MGNNKTRKKPTPRSGSSSRRARRTAGHPREAGIKKAPSRQQTIPTTKRTTQLNLTSRPRVVPRAKAPSTTVPPFIAPSAEQKRAQRKAAARRSRVQRGPMHTSTKVLLVVVGVVASCLLALFIISRTPLFTISDVEADATEHISSDSIVQLADLDSSATLLNFDENAITTRLKKNPWVESVSFTREFPGTLKINVTERSVKAIVTMSSGEVAWCLGSDDSWIEPISIDVADGQDLDEAALAQAQQMGVILISDVPSSVSPQAGSSASDETIEAVSEFQSEFSDDLSSQIVSYSASSTSSISCTLSSGLTISLGSASDIETKESIINSLIEKYPDRLTYINVRVTSSPSYRMIDSDEVQSGTGTSG